MPCECPNENFLCHAKDGCVCRQGYTGTCDVTVVWFQLCRLCFLTYLLFLLFCGPLTSTGFILNFQCVGLECLNPPQYDTLSLHFNLLQKSWRMRIHVGHFWILLQMCVSVYVHTHICNTILYSQFCASWLYINKIQRDVAVWRCLYSAKLLYMLRVSIAPIIRSTSNCNCSFWYRS